VATLDDVHALALALPETEEGTTYGNRAWKVRGKAFAWHRPLRAKELDHLGADAPDGTVLATCVEHEVAKRALLDEGRPYFTTPHFDGYAIVLVELDALPPADLEELVSEAWLARAPARLAREWLAARKRSAALAEVARISEEFDGGYR